ncbi:hypothetical protein HWV62_20808 [Athelia sp. TMB]|nr:hypothetical protein HWV62_20808 [Athelia sp. TMB]
MSTGSFNPDTVEESAQKLLHYEKTMQLHLVELRKNPETLLATHDLVSRSPPSAQAGQRWPPESHRRDEYMKQMDEICARHPSSDKDQAFSRELVAMQQQNAASTLPYEPPVSSPTFWPPSPVTASPSRIHPYSSPSNLTRRLLTHEEKAAYSANPIGVVGRHFILDPDSADPLPYKVIGVRVSEGITIYEVLLAGCCHADDLEQEEVEGMMNDSVILE